MSILMNGYNKRKAGTKKRNKKLVAIALVLCQCLMIVYLVAIVTALMRPITQTYSIIKDWVESYGVNAPRGLTTKVLENWAEIDLDKIEDNYEMNINSFNLSEAVALEYYGGYHKSIVSDGDYEAYVNLFKSDNDETCFNLVEARYGYKIEDRIMVQNLTLKLDEAQISRMSDNGFYGSVGMYSDSHYYTPKDEMFDVIWNSAKNFKGGINPFWKAGESGGYDPRQCTTFAWYRFYQQYGYDSGARGNGISNAREIVKKHPDKFRLSSTASPGAIFSATSNSDAGHTGFVEACTKEYIWISDGNVNGNGSLRINYKMSIDAFNAEMGEVEYAVPTTS